VRPLLKRPEDQPASVELVVRHALFPCEDPRVRILARRSHSQ
jgi:hypothetical protein